MITRSFPNPPGPMWKSNRRVSLWKRQQSYFSGFGSSVNHGERHYPQMENTWNGAEPGVAGLPKILQEHNDLFWR